MNPDFLYNEPAPEDEIHFAITWVRVDDIYAVDMPLVGSDRKARVFTGTLNACLDFIREITEEG